MSEAPERIQSWVYAGIEAPEKIWAWVYADPWGNEMRWFEWQDYKPDAGDTEYIRADLVEAAVKRAIEACAVEIGKHPSIQIETYADHMSWRHSVKRSIRTIASDPEAIAKIVRGE